MQSPAAIRLAYVSDLDPLLAELPQPLYLVQIFAIITLIITDDH